MSDPGLTHIYAVPTRLAGEPVDLVAAGNGDAEMAERPKRRIVAVRPLEEDDHELRSEPRDSGPIAGYCAFIADPDDNTLEIAHGHKVAFSVEEAAKGGPSTRGPGWRKGRCR